MRVRRAAQIYTVVCWADGGVSHFHRSGMGGVTQALFEELGIDEEAKPECLEYPKNEAFFAVETAEADEVTVDE